MTTTPTLRRNLDDLPQTPGIDRIGLDWLAVVPVLRRDLFTQIDDTRWTDQLQQELLRVAPKLMGDFRHEGLGAEGMRDVVHGAEPADPGMRLRFARLDAQVRDIEWRIDQPEPELDEEGMLRVRREGRQYARRRAALAPSHDLVAGVEASLEPIVPVLPRRRLNRDRFAGTEMDVPLDGQLAASTPKLESPRCTGRVLPRIGDEEARTDIESHRRRLDRCPAVEGVENAQQATQTRHGHVGLGSEERDDKFLALLVVGSARDDVCPTR